MKQVKQLLIVLFVGLLFVSCDKNKEIKQFATDFAAAVQSGNKSEITKTYPGAAAADSLVFAFDVEKFVDKCKKLLEKKLRKMAT